MKAHLWPGLLAGLLLTLPASGQVVSLAGKVLGVSVGYTRGYEQPLVAWRTGTAYDPPPEPDAANPRPLTQRGSRTHPCTSGLSLSLYADATSVVNGLSVAAFLNGGEVRNGVTVAGLWCQVDTLRGVGVGGAVLGRHLRGVLLAPLSLGGNLDGSRQVCRQVSGVALGGLLVRAQSLDGLAVGGFVRSRRLRGLAIGVLNRTDELHGGQLGLLNYAGNNPRGLRWLPLLNLHR